MSKRIAINGLGRIGRLVLRSCIERDYDVVLVNSPADTKTLSHLLKYDSIHGKANFECIAGDQELIINGKSIEHTKYRSPSLIKSSKFTNIDLMLECSGKFNSFADASGHLQAGFKKVVISAPASDADYTIVLGVNEKGLNDRHKIISIGSCTTNALAPLAKVINDNFKINTGFVTTIHAYTSDQNLVDNSHEDIARARAANLSIIPTQTGAAKTLKLVLPELADKINVSAVRVPVANVSAIDFVFSTNEKISIDSINNAFDYASKSMLKGILSVAEDRLVSIDYNHNKYSIVYDPYETKVISPCFARIFGWYDNEWAFANRMTDIINLL